jgi:hypothetical protein
MAQKYSNIFQCNALQSLLKIGIFGLKSNRLAALLLTYLFTKKLPRVEKPSFLSCFLRETKKNVIFFLKSVKRNYCLKLKKTLKSLI